MLNGHSQHDIDDSDELDQLFSMSDLSESDMGKYTMKILPGSDRVYRYKFDRTSRILDTMETYRKEGRLCDAVLCVKGERYPVHKVVLASTCPYFASLFHHQNTPETHASKDFDLTQLIPCSKALKVILDFIYTSQVQLNDKNVMGVLTSSIPILLEDLIELCVAYLRDQLHPSNCVGLFLYGKQYLCKSLVTAAEQYIYDHFEEVVRHEEFLSLNLNDLCSIFKNDKVKVPCESIVYNAAMQWCRHDLLSRRPQLEQVLPCIRLQFLGPSFVRRVMTCDDFAPPDMQGCREYLSTVHENLTSHRYCRLPPHRDPIKPLVIYCAGGYYNKSINTMECYFSETQRWKRCADLGVPRSGVGVVSLFMRVYVIGGRHNTRNENKDCQDVERYDPFMNEWTKLAPMLYPRNRLGVGAVDHSIYAVGGSSGQQIHRSVERYTVVPDSGAWIEVASMNVGRIGLAVCTLNRLLYAIGGFDGHRRLADVESYNPDENIWKREQPLLCGRSGAAAAALAQCIYVVGGYASDAVDGSMQLDVVERYDTITQQWSYVRPMNCRRSALSCVILDKHLFALGGYDGKNFSSVVEVYDPEKDEWTFSTPLTRERSGHGSALTVEPTLIDDE